MNFTVEEQLSAPANRWHNLVQRTHGYGTAMYECMYVDV